MFKYETHLHTFPVSACAKASVRENLECYKAMGYDGVFITNHFLDGNINIDRSLPYEQKVNFYFSDYEAALPIGEQLGIKVFLGVEMSYRGTDFLVYGLDKQWFLQNPQIMEMPQKQKLAYLSENGAYIVQAHPYREANYIDHIRLFPRSVNAVEVVNGCCRDEENNMAKIYARNYGLAEVAGTDNHLGVGKAFFAGVMTEAPLNSAQDYIRMLKDGQVQIFTYTKESI